MRSALVLLVAFGSLGVGCKSKKEEKVDKLKDDLAPIVEKYSEKTKAVLAAIPAIGKSAVAAEKVTARTPVSRKFEFDIAQPLDTGTLIETAGLLVERTAKVEINISEDLYAKRLNQVMEGTYKNPDGSKKHLEADFKRVAGIKQIAAVRFHEVKHPKMTGDKSFTPGHAIGDVLIYDVESKKLIGSFPFHASNAGDKTVMVKKKNPASSLEGKFTAAVTHAIFEEMVAYLADKPGPASPGSQPAPTDKKDDKPADKPADKKDEKPADKPADKPAEKPAAKPADKPAGGGGW